MTTILNYSMIKKVLIVLPFYLFTFLPLSAQTYTQRIQQQNGNGQGTVTIHQDADLKGILATDMILKQLIHEPVSEKRVILPVRLIERGSVRQLEH